MYSYDHEFGAAVQIPDSETKFLQPDIQEKTMSKTFLKVQAIVASLILGAVTLPALAGPPKWAQQLDTTIVGTAVALSGGIAAYDDNDEDFDILVAAVVATGYAVDPLNGSDDYTVFAPEDAAFLAVVDSLVEAEACAELEDSNMNGSVEDEAVTCLVAVFGGGGIRAILDYHVTEGVRNSPSVLRAKKITMLDGNTITARGGFVDAFGSDAEFVDTDFRVADGMIHIIGSVLIPPL